MCEVALLKLRREKTGSVLTIRAPIINGMISFEWAMRKSGWEPCWSDPPCLVRSQPCDVLIVLEKDNQRVEVQGHFDGTCTQWDEEYSPSKGWKFVRSNPMSFTMVL